MFIMSEDGYSSIKDLFEDTSSEVSIKEVFDDSVSEVGDSVSEVGNRDGNIGSLSMGCSTPIKRRVRVIAPRPSQVHWRLA